MVNRIHLGRSGTKKRATGAAALVAAALVAQLPVPALAGQAAAGFRVSITLVNPHFVEPDAPAAETGCTATSSPASQIIKCNLVPATPPAAGVPLPGGSSKAGGIANNPPAAQPPLAAALLPPVVAMPPVTPSQARPDPLVATHRARKTFAGYLTPLAGGDAWGDGMSLYHEYTRRVVRLGEVEYQEDMFSW